MGSTMECGQQGQGQDAGVCSYLCYQIRKKKGKFV